MILTLVLGVATAAAFYVGGGPLALRGTYALVRQWPLIYTLEASIVGGIGLALGWASVSRVSLRVLTLLIVAAWIGEYVVVASGLLANELAFWYSPLSGVAIWIAATAGPVQPLAVWLGTLLGRRLRRRRLARA